jgi:hypothetical protein
VSGLLDRVCGMFRCNSCGCGCCCEPACGCNSCGCDSCGNGGCDGCNGGDAGHESEGEDKPEAAPAEAGASVKPIPPRPMADPNASVGQQRSVVRTSFLR